MYKDSIQIAFENLKNRKLRTSLTILGIIIGISTIFALISIGEGLENGIEEQFEKIGTNRLYIAASGSTITGLQSGLSNDDVDTLESMGEFTWVTPYLQENANVEFSKETKYVQIWGVVTDDLDRRWEDIGLTLSEGRLFREGEKYVTIIGATTASEIFKREIHVNENIKINDKRFKVIGIFDPIGNPEDDSVIELPLDIAQELLEKRDQVTVIEAIIKEGLNAEEVAKKTERVLERKRGNDLFEIITPDQVMQQFTTVSAIVNTILIAIAGISIIVGGIGIMNSTYTSVLERKKEIGIMKAIGAQNKDILLLFLIEAAVVGFIGGIIGITIGFGIGKLAQVGAELAGYQLLKIKFNALLTLFSLMFAIGVGMLAGYFPAKEAMNKQAVEALRGK
jgi:putative ABC transport system permease protein